MALRQRLLTADVNDRTGQMAFLQRLDQICVHNRYTAPNVNEQRRWLEAGEQLRVIQVVGLRCIGQ